MTTVQDLYARIYPHALAAYAQKSPDMESAKQMARAVSAECATECARLGIVTGGSEEPRQPQPFGSGAPGIPTFAETKLEGNGSTPVVPPGAPMQPVQHYNHVPTQSAPSAPAPSVPSAPPIGGQQIFPPSGPKYEPPPQAGVMGTVTQVPTPAGFNALGTNGVIQQPEQRPNGKDVVVAPGNQPMIPSVGGNGTMFVPEKIVR